MKKAKPILVIRLFNAIAFPSEDFEGLLERLKGQFEDYYVLLRVYSDSPDLPEIEVLNPSDKLKDIDLEALMDFIERERG